VGGVGGGGVGVGGAGGGAIGVGGAGGAGGAGGVGRPGGIVGVGGRPGYGVGGGGLGAIAGGNTGVVSSRSPTVNVNQQALVNQGNAVRNNFNNFGSFGGNWWGRYPGAWRAAGWGAAGAAFGTRNWGALSSYCGYPAEPAYYDYGSNLVADGQSVYYNGDPIATQEQYVQQAVTIADAGRQAVASKEEEWLTLGVFAIVQGEQVNGNDLFQLAVNKAGTIRGNYYNALADITMPVYGSVDSTTQRAAWTVGDRNETIYEAGFANLTRPETTMLVHFGKDRTQQWNLVRMEQPASQ
jgi:hypothetical protein